MRTYFRSFLIEIYRTQEYMFSFISSLLYVPISIFIYYFLYRYILQNSAGFSMNLNEILIYYSIVLFIRSAISHSMAEVYIVFTDINTGSLDLWLSRPVSYPLVRYSHALGSVTATVPCSLLLLFFFLLFWEKLHPTQILLFLFSVFLGFSVLFFTMFLLGTFTFWIKNVLTLRDIFWVAMSLLSGEMIPLNLLPESLQFLIFNPLASIYYLPSQVLYQKSPAYILQIQLFYTLILGLSSFFFWNLGLRKYESQGG